MLILQEVHNQVIDKWVLLVALETNSIMELIITEDNPKILEIYSYDNYKVEYSPLCKNNRCIIFFSGNGLYYPDTIE